MYRIDDIKNEIFEELVYDGRLIDFEDLKNKYGMSYSTCYRFAQKYNLLNRPKRTINLIDDYLKGITTKELALKYSMSDVNVRNLIKNAGYKVRKSRYIYDTSYFSNINTEQQSYFLGLVFADGNVSKNNLSIGLRDYDIDILNKFNFELKSNKPLRFISNRGGYNGKQEDAISNMVKLEISSTEMIKDLKRYGVVENKTKKITFPQLLNRELYRHFIRGYFDGDGSFSVYETYTVKKKSGKKYKSIKYEVSFVGTIELLSEFKLIIERETNSKCNTKLYQRHKGKDDNIRALKITGKKNVSEFLKWIYEPSTISLDRKREKFNQFIM